MKEDSQQHVSRSTIRPYDPARDLERCMETWRQASEVGHPFLGPDALDPDQQVIRDRYMPAAEILVEGGDNGPRGFIALLGSMVGGLFVNPEYHGRGVGSALVLEAARDRRALDVEVYEANEGARVFYLRAGFVEVSRRELDDHGRPLPLIRMRRENPHAVGAR